MLKAENLKKTYKAKSVINDISLSVKHGEIVGLLGPNGAGKTTCFYLILGLVNQNSGKVSIDGDDLTRLPIHGRARKGVGYLPQDPSIFKNLNVEENILAVIETQKSIPPKERIDLLENLLVEFNIIHIRKSLGITLSGGERRRVEIARALASNPKFILLDELFSYKNGLLTQTLKIKRTNVIKRYFKEINSLY